MMTKNYCPSFDEATWHRSCKEEIVDPICGKVVGIIPKWLNGVLLRNGPGLYQFGETTMNHFFDGMALLHRFEIKDGIATYQCRFVQSEIYKKNRGADRIVVTDFGTVSVPDPCRTIFHRISSVFSLNKNLPDNAAISVYPFGDQIYALAETGVMYRIDDNTLETKNKVNLGMSLGIVTHTSHPHITEDGSVYNLAFSFSTKGALYHVVHFPNDPKHGVNDSTMFDRAHVVATIPARWRVHPSYMHSFGITENYFVIVEQPLTLAVPRRLVKIFHKVPAHALMKWYKDETTKITIVDRKTGKPVQKFYCKGFCYFHIINQYEHLNHIVLDICTYKDPSLIDSVYINIMKNAQHNPNYVDMIRSSPQRFVLPLSNKCDRIDDNLVDLPNTTAKAYKTTAQKIFVDPEVLCDVICDMPTIYYDQFVGKKYQYFYGISSCAADVNPGAIIKVDVDNKISTSWSEKGCYPGEAIFVPCPNSQSEDDGVLLSSLIYGENENNVCLLILDAKTFKEVGKVSFETPSAVPRTLHGWYFPNS